MAKEPMRVIDGEAKPHEPFWTMRVVKMAGAKPEQEPDAGDPGEEQEGLEIEFNGPISEYSWWGDEITPQLFKDELYGKGKGNPVTCFINSPGGEVIAASRIRTILQEYPGKVTCDITGLCASAATVMVTGADHVRMRQSAMFMIHDPSALAFGNIEDLLGVVDTLKAVKSGIVDTYATKTGMAPEKISKMMAAETWMSARQACDMGFVDEVVTASTCKPMMAARVGFVNCLSNYANAPAELLAAVQGDDFYEDTPEAPVHAQPVIEPDGAQALRERVQSILKGRA